MEPAGLAPVRAFLLIATLATILGGAVFATRDAAPSEPPAPARSPDVSLTDEEAIAEFERLKLLLLNAYEKRDVSLISAFAAPDAAPGIRRVDDEIQALLTDDVLYRTREREESLTVVRNSPNEIELREVVVKFPRFVDGRTGRNLATDAGPERQSITWVLRTYDAAWRIHSSTVIAAEPLKDGRA
jgi:hypothetical protein